MNLSQLRAFHAVATWRSFSAAAQRLGVSQPAVTQHIKSLEDRLGTRLFHRGGGGAGVDLTPDGRALLPRARQVVMMVDDIGTELEQGRRLQKGFLTLGMCAPFVALPLVRRFAEQHPGVRLEIRLDNSERLLDALAASRIDAAVATVSEPRAEFVYQRLVEQRVLVLVPRQHPWAIAGAVAAEELAGTPFVLRENGSMTRRLFERGLGRIGIEVDVRLVLGSREAMKEAVATGFGAGIVLDREVGHDSRLAAVPIAGVEMRADECLVTLPEMAELGAVRALRLISGSLDWDREMPAAYGR